MDFTKLQPLHMDFLKEIGNIGAGNAVTSLAQMTGKKIGMEVPSSSIARINHLMQLLGDEEELVSCVNVAVSGDAQASIFFILKHQNALGLLDRLMGQPHGSYREIDAIGQSALNEVGNIIAGSLLNAISSLTGLSFLSSVPAYANDMLGAVLSAALLERGYFDDHVLVINTRFYDQDVVLDGNLFLLPKGNALETIFKSVGISWG